MPNSFENIIYNGERDGVHNWESISGMHYYWHPDWLHIAEDMTGHRATVNIQPKEGAVTAKDAAEALSKHLKNGA